MKRSEINQVYLSANDCFTRNGWLLPPNAKWEWDNDEITGYFDYKAGRLVQDGGEFRIKCSIDIPGALPQCD